MLTVLERGDGISGSKSDRTLCPDKCHFLDMLQEAVRKSEYWRLKDDQGRPPGVLGLWPARAVSFIENHDTGSTQVRPLWLVLLPE